MRGTRSAVWAAGLAVLVASAACVSSPAETADTPFGTTATTAGPPASATTTVPPPPPAGTVSASTTTEPATTATGAAPSTTTSIATATASSSTRAEAGSAAAGAVPVISITDGDTFRALVDGRSEPIRLIGINAPESGECLADEAAAFLASLIEAKSVTLMRDVSDRDRFGRLLRHVWVDGIMVGEALVRAGYAVARRYEPDVEYDELLAKAQADAQAAQSGIWAPGACGKPAGGAVVIDAYQYDAPGNDNQNLNGEWIRLRNDGTAPLVMTGWVVKDESASHRFRFPPGFTLAVGRTVTIYTGCGNDTPTSLYWCNSGSAVWNNSGDTIFILDPSGGIVAFESY